VYTQVVNASWKAMKKMDKIVVKMVDRDVPETFQLPMKHKMAMYVGFLVLVAVSIAVEITLHELMFSGAGYATTILIYEVASLIILSTILYIFRPQELSPFFFLMPTTAARQAEQDQDQRRRKPATTLQLVGEFPSDAAMDDSDENTRLIVDMDILPLNPRRNEVGTNAKMALLRDPTSYSVGIATDSSFFINQQAAIDRDRDRDRNR